jgi:hypothetical protein
MLSFQIKFKINIIPGASLSHTFLLSYINVIFPISLGKKSIRVLSYTPTVLHYYSYFLITDLCPFLLWVGGAPFPISDCKFM